MSKAALFDVQRSASGRKWLAIEGDADMASKMARQEQVPELLATIMAGRGIEPKNAAQFLRPSFKQQFPDPMSFKDMGKAVDLILEAIQNQNNITIFADYDVDGATSSAQLSRWCRKMGIEADIYVPDRISEGYGPSGKAFETIAASGAQLVITVDCGAVSHDPIAHARALGMRVIVLDHHLMDDGPMPEADALVNPNRPDEDGKFGYLAAAGLVFILLAALNQQARERGMFEEIAEPNLLELAELAALGTVCDVAQLKGFNRVLVAQGMRAMGKLTAPGLGALADVARVEPPFTSYHAGFVFGPRINAGGRIGESNLGALLLSSDDPGEVSQIAEQLDVLNTERREMEKNILDDADLMAAKLLDRPLIVVASKNWHPGVIGIVAGRLKDKYNRPSLVIAIDNDGTGQGSGRSVSGVNLGEAFGLAARQGIIIKGGGHAMAGGLSVTARNIPKLYDFLEEKLGKDILQAGRTPSLKIAASAGLDGVNLELVKELARLEPFGMGNPEPVLAFPGVLVTWAKRLNGGHVRCQLETETGSTSISAICFRAEDRGLDELLLGSDGQKLHIAGKIKLDTWNGREKVSFQIEDIALA